MNDQKVFKRKVFWQDGNDLSSPNFVFPVELSYQKHGNEFCSAVNLYMFLNVTIFSQLFTYCKSSFLTCCEMHLCGFLLKKITCINTKLHELSICRKKAAQWFFKKQFMFRSYWLCYWLVSPPKTDNYNNYNYDALEALFLKCWALPIKCIWEHMIRRCFF